MSKTLRRDKAPWWPSFSEPGKFGCAPEVKGVKGLKNRRDCTSCNSKCMCKYPFKRMRMKKVRQSARLDIDERM